MTMTVPLAIPEFFCEGHNGTASGPYADHEGDCPDQQIDIAPSPSPTTKLYEQGYSGGCDFATGYGFQNVTSHGTAIALGLKPYARVSNKHGEFIAQYDGTTNSAFVRYPLALEDSVKDGKHFILAAVDMIAYSWFNILTTAQGPIYTQRRECYADPHTVIATKLAGVLETELSDHIDMSDQGFPVHTSIWYIDNANQLHPVGGQNRLPPDALFLHFRTWCSSPGTGFRTDSFVTTNSVHGKYTGIVDGCAAAPFGVELQNGGNVSSITTAIPTPDAGRGGDQVLTVMLGGTVLAEPAVEPSCLKTLDGTVLDTYRRRRFLQSGFGSVEISIELKFESTNVTNKISIDHVINKQDAPLIDPIVGFIIAGTVLLFAVTLVAVYVVHASKAAQAKAADTAPPPTELDAIVLEYPAPEEAAESIPPPPAVEGAKDSKDSQVKFERARAVFEENP